MTSRVSRRTVAAGLASGAVLTASCAAAQGRGRVGDPVTGPQSGLRVEPLEIVTASGVRRFQVEVADTDRTREVGMMFRRSLPWTRGMLFDFEVPQPNAAFWMRNTLIPLDILYIRPDGRILSIARSATPRSEVPIPSGGGPILGVLELAGGAADRFGIQPGDQVRHRIFRRTARPATSRR